MAGTDAKLTNAVFELTVQLGNRINPCSLVDTQSGFGYVDASYRYTLAMKGQEEAQGLVYTAHQTETLTDGSERLTLIGLIAGLRVAHVFEASPDPSFLQETIVFTNETEETIEIENLSFGFRKNLAALPTNFHLVAVPYRIQVDGKVHDYAQEDLVNHRIQNSDWTPPWLESQKLWNNEAGRSEGWILTDEQQGLLVIKYDQTMMDYSIAGVEGEQHLFFGGVGLCLYGEPSAVRTLQPGQRIVSGTTRYVFIEGGWREGYRHFKAFMNERGHSFPEKFNPPVHWNELFDVGWYHSDREELFKYYTREALFYECQKAAELGCEQLYLDPGWEICEGTTLWDDERLGKVGDFVAEVKDRFGLTIAFRTIGRVYRNEFPVDWYIQKTEKAEAYTPYSEVYAGRTRIIWEVCTAHQPWREEKLRRLLNIMQGGVQFVLFDEFEWRGPCYNAAHGHTVPSTPDEHAQAVYWLAEEIHKCYPDVLIEAHDPVWAWYTRYAPTYYHHGHPYAYDENWGFEFMWNPIADLLSGKALSLYYYNLAYDIPLYDHLTMEGDNDQALSFWWYASTVRHLGIGGKKGLNSSQENEVRYQVYKKAMRLYRSLKDLYTHGVFHGVDELTHVHYLPGTGRAVCNAFNITQTPVKKTLTIDLLQIGLDPEKPVFIHGVAAEKNALLLHLQVEIPPVSPVIIPIQQE